MPSIAPKVLLIEDDQLILDMYKIRLEEEGYEVLVTDKGSEALALARKENPSVILLDIILPEMDGFAILEELKKDAKAKAIPVVMLTNLSQESDKKKGEEMGAVDYFVKAQHTPLDIINKVKELINKP